MLILKLLALGGTVILGLLVLLAGATAPLWYRGPQ